MGCVVARRPTRFCVPRRARRVRAQGAKLDIQVLLEPADRSTDQGSRLIALVYLLIGLYVLLRRWTAPEVDAFLCVLPGVVCAVCVSADIRAGDVRPGDLLGQPAGDHVAAGAVPALCGELLGRGGRQRSAQREVACWLAAPAAGRAAVCAGSVPDGLAAVGDRALVGDRHCSAIGWTRSASATWRCTTWWRRWCSIRAMCARVRRWSGSN